MSAERTDDDTWDLATSVGATATMVAAGRARATKANLIDDRFAEPLVRAVGVDFFTRWATGELAAADVDVPGAFWGMQQMTDLLTARTRYFDAFLTDATDAGIRQVVILASGLDARGYRLAWPAGTVVFEIDQPEVLAFKAATLAELKAAPTAEVRTVPIDLRQDWPAALRDGGLRRDQALRMDRRRPAAVPARGGPGSPAGQHHRAQRRRQPAGVGGGGDVGLRGRRPIVGLDGRRHEALARPRLRHRARRTRLPGGARDVADYLDSRGWRSVRKPLRELLADAGLPKPPELDGAPRSATTTTACR